jgi:DNA-binding transcriptional MerR regulator
MEKPFQFIGLEEAARLLQVPFYKIRYAHKAGHIPEPPRIGTRRVYDPETLEQLRAYFAARK